MDNFLNSLKVFAHPRVITMLFLGFSAGIPILLIFSSLSLWLNEAGVQKSAITYFSWAALGYSFKFVWAPLIDRLPLPILTNWFGRRRAWMLVAQVLIILSIIAMAMINPQSSEQALTYLAFAAVALGFSSATQDIVIDAYRIESAGSELQPMMSATYIAGYRIGMLVAGAGALVLAATFGSTKAVYSYNAWQMTYLIMSATMLIGVLTTLIINEPVKNQSQHTEYTSTDYGRFFLLFLVLVVSFVTLFIILAPLTQAIKTTLFNLFGEQKHLFGFMSGTIRMVLSLIGVYWVAQVMIKLHIVNQQMVLNTYINPVKDFFIRYGIKTAILLLCVVGFYRVSDIVLGVIANVFYQDIGFSKIEIAEVSKTFGLLMTILGGFIGGILATRFGIFGVLFLGALLSSLTNLLFILMANIGYDISWLYFIISFDNISAGIAGAAFIAFLSRLTNIEFTAIQYAVFSSLTTLFPKILAGYSGTIIEVSSYQSFFLMTTIIGIPVLWLVWKMRPYID